MVNQDSYVGVAGQKLVLLEHLQRLLAPVDGLRSTERLQEWWTAKGNSS